jgi:uroporphyrinogen-III synthase
LGWDVCRVEAYRTVPRPAPEPALLDRVAAADAVTFTAPSAVQAFVTLRGASGLEVMPPPQHVVCIGATTAAAARAAGLDGVREARDASAEGIVDELIDALAAGPDHGP